MQLAYATNSVSVQGVFVAYFLLFFFSLVFVFEILLLMLRNYSVHFHAMELNG